MCPKYIPEKVSLIEWPWSQVCGCQIRTQGLSEEHPPLFYKEVGKQKNPRVGALMFINNIIQCLY